LKRDRANQIKWDIVDHLLSHFSEGEYEVADYTPEELGYAVKQIRRVAAMLNVTDHMDLS
jgi:hypothetical protein